MPFSDLVISTKNDSSFQVEAQEMKLRKLRALRGNSDSGMQRQLQMPASVSADLDSIRVLFTDKEKELTLAVKKTRIKSKSALIEASICNCLCIPESELSHACAR